MAWFHDKISDLEHKNCRLLAEIQELKKELKMYQEKLGAITDVVVEKKQTPRLTDATYRYIRDVIGKGR